MVKFVEIVMQKKKTTNNKSKKSIDKWLWEKIDNHSKNNQQWREYR